MAQGRRPSGAVLHSSREPGVRHPCSDFMDMLRRLINCHIIIHSLYSHVTSRRRQKSVVSVVSCRFLSSITTTCWQQVGSFPVYRKVTEKRV